MVDMQKKKSTWFQYATHVSQHPATVRTAANHTERAEEANGVVHACVAQALQRH
jgi:hypothetical protein